MSVQVQNLTVLMLCKATSEMYSRPLFLTRMEFPNNYYLFAEMECDSIMEFARQGTRAKIQKFLNIENEDALKIFEEVLKKYNPEELNEFKAFVNAGYVLLKKSQLNRYSGTKQ